MSTIDILYKLSMILLSDIDVKPYIQRLQSTLPSLSPGANRTVGYVTESHWQFKDVLISTIIDIPKMNCTYSNLARTGTHRPDRLKGVTLIKLKMRFQS
jgi:hypothetical protein